MEKITTEANVFAPIHNIIHIAVETLALEAERSVERFDNHKIQVNSLQKTHRLERQFLGWQFKRGIPVLFLQKSQFPTLLGQSTTFSTSP